MTLGEEILQDQIDRLEDDKRELTKMVFARDEALRYLMNQFDSETWQCPVCRHADDTATMDSAYWLRDWLKTHNVKVTGDPQLHRGASS